MRLVPFLFLLCALCGLAGAEQPVYFADPVLKEAVEAALWMPNPTPQDMLSLTRFACREKGIEHITGLEYAANLQDLSLRWNLISNLSPLSGLTHLERLDLSRNRASNLSPLSGLTNLRHLDLHDNGISDISPLAGLSNLQTLILHVNEIADITVLSALTNLQNLDLFTNQVSDLSPLTSLTSLKVLDLRVNPLSVESCAVCVPQIVANNPGLDFDSDVCVSRTVSISSSLGGTVTQPGEGTFTYQNGELVRLVAVAEPCFAFAEWSGSYFTRQNPAILRAGQDHSIQASFVSVLDVIYVDDDAGPPEIEVSDFEQTGGVEHPFDTIQRAIEVAANGAYIIVRPGVYRENIDLLGKSVQVVGLDPNEPDKPRLPVLDGAGSAPVITCTKGEGPDCMVMGFVITRGQGGPAGAIYCNGSSPTIANCLIVGNRVTTQGGAAVYCTASTAAFVNCTIADNYGGPAGAGLSQESSAVVVTNSILWGNVPCDLQADAGSEPCIRYTNIGGGWRGEGNIDHDPLFARRGYWGDAQDPALVVDPASAETLWQVGDYHLQSEAGRWDRRAQSWVRDEVTSPCVDAGDPGTPFAGEPAPNGGVVNLGAYGGTCQSSRSPSPF